MRVSFQLVVAPEVSFADVCSVRNSLRIVVASVYVSPSAPNRKIVDFLSKTFVPEHDVPLMVTGDFNVNIKDPHNGWLIQCVLKSELGMPFLSNTQIQLFANRVLFGLP